MLRVISVVSLFSREARIVNRRLYDLNMESGLPGYSAYLSDCNSPTVISPRSRRTRSRSAAPGVTGPPAPSAARLSRRNRSSSPPQYSSRYCSAAHRYCCMLSAAQNRFVNISNLRAGRSPAELRQYYGTYLVFTEGFCCRAHLHLHHLRLISAEHADPLTIVPRHQPSSCLQVSLRLSQLPAGLQQPSL